MYFHTFNFAVSGYINWREKLKAETVRAAHKFKKVRELFYACDSATTDAYLSVSQPTYSDMQVPVDELIKEWKTKLPNAYKDTVPSATAVMGKTNPKLNATPIYNDDTGEFEGYPATDVPTATPINEFKRKFPSAGYNVKSSKATTLVGNEFRSVGAIDLYTFIDKFQTKHGLPFVNADGTRASIDQIDHMMDLVIAAGTDKAFLTPVTERYNENAFGDLWQGMQDGVTDWFHGGSGGGKADEDDLNTRKRKPVLIPSSIVNKITYRVTTAIGGVGVRFQSAETVSIPRSNIFEEIGGGTRTIDKYEVVGINSKYMVAGGFTYDNDHNIIGNTYSHVYNYPSKYSVGSKPIREVSTLEDETDAAVYNLIMFAVRNVQGLPANYGIRTNSTFPMWINGLQNMANNLKRRIEHIRTAIQDPAYDEAALTPIGELLTYMGNMESMLESDIGQLDELYLEFKFNLFDGMNNNGIEDKGKAGDDEMFRALRSECRLWHKYVHANFKVIPDKPIFEDREAEVGIEIKGDSFALYNNTRNNYGMKYIAKEYAPGKYHNIREVIASGPYYKYNADVSVSSASVDLVLSPNNVVHCDSYILDYDKVITSTDPRTIQQILGCFATVSWGIPPPKEKDRDWWSVVVSFLVAILVTVVSWGTLTWLVVLAVSTAWTSALATFLYVQTGSEQWAGLARLLGYVTTIATFGASLAANAVRWVSEVIKYSMKAVSYGLDKYYGRQLSSMQKENQAILDEIDDVQELALSEDVEARDRVQEFVYGGNIVMKYTERYNYNAQYKYDYYVKHGSTKEILALKKD